VAGEGWYVTTSRIIRVLLHDDVTHTATNIKADILDQKGRCAQIT
jgi:hypothetical protein